MERKFLIQHTKKIESNYSPILSSPFYNAYLSNGKCSYYNHGWREILPCIYDCIKFPLIKDNIIAVSMHDKFGIVNFDNEALTEFIYDTTEDAQKALFQIQENYLQCIFRSIPVHIPVAYKA